jgi:Uncharacterized anaerobic dehydrogenase
VGDISVLSGHCCGDNGGIIQLLSGANSQGLANIGVLPGARLAEDIAEGRIHGLFVFGEEIDIDLSELDFLAVQELQMTATAAKADIVLPASSFAETAGSYTGADGITRELRPAVSRPASGRDSFTQIAELSANAGTPLCCGSIDAAKVIGAAETASAQATGLVVPGSDSLCRAASHSTDALYLGFAETAKYVLEGKNA